MKVELRMAKLFKCTQLNGTSETPISDLTLLTLLSRRPQEANVLPSDSHRWLSQDLGLTRLPKILHGNGTEPGLHLPEFTW